MKQSNKTLKFSDVKVLGSYGEMYHNLEVYPHSLRKLSKDVKKNDVTAIAIAALLLSKLIVPNAVLIPIPQSSGKASNTLELANTIKIIRHDCEVIDILSGKTREKLYDIKKTQSSVKRINLGLKVKENTNCKETLLTKSNIFLIDNVVNTGLTFIQARRALKAYADVEPTLLAISATHNWFN